MTRASSETFSIALTPFVTGQVAVATSGEVRSPAVGGLNLRLTQALQPPIITGRLSLRRSRCLTVPLTIHSLALAPATPRLACLERCRHHDGPSSPTVGAYHPRSTSIKAPQSRLRSRGSCPVPAIQNSALAHLLGRTPGISTA